jgi:hypothetical protein
VSPAWPGVVAAEVAFGPPEILPRTDLVDFRLEFCLLAERYTEHVAAAEPQLLAFRPGHDLGKIKPLRGPLLEFIRPGRIE